MPFADLQVPAGSCDAGGRMVGIINRSNITGFAVRRYLREG